MSKPRIVTKKRLYEILTRRLLVIGIVIRIVAAFATQIREFYLPNWPRSGGHQLLVSSHVLCEPVHSKAAARRGDGLQDLSQSHIK